MAKVTDVIYLHRDKDSNWDKGQELGIPDEFIRDRFAYTGYELGITCEIDTESGACYAVALEGVMLDYPVLLN